MSEPMTDLAAIAGEIAQLRSLASDALRRRWGAMFGRKPPAGLSRDLLRRMIAMRLQEQAFGSLDRESLRFLGGLARRGGPLRRHLKPGSVLVREYQGERHTVTVGREGFEWQGATYSSLSAIARAITGTAWSGPRFFALRTPGDPARRADAQLSAQIGRRSEPDDAVVNAMRADTSAETRNPAGQHGGGDASQLAFRGISART